MAWGAEAEAQVAAVLCRRQWRLLDCNWRCRWGELDLMLAKPQRLLLVEVKARRRWGLDHGGLLACGPRKRCRLARATRLSTPPGPASQTQPLPRPQPQPCPQP